MNKIIVRAVLIVLIQLSAQVNTQAQLIVLIETSNRTNYSPANYTTSISKNVLMSFLNNDDSISYSRYINAESQYPKNYQKYLAQFKKHFKYKSKAKDNKKSKFTDQIIYFGNDDTKDSDNVWCSYTLAELTNDSTLKHSLVVKVSFEGETVKKWGKIPLINEVSVAASKETSTLDQGQQNQVKTLLEAVQRKNMSSEPPRY